MIKILLLIVVSLLCIFGLAEILHSIKLHFIYSKKSGPSFSVVCLDKSNAEQQLYFAASQRQWLGKKYADHIIAINSFLECQDYIKCEKIAKKHGIIYCSFEELDSVLLYFTAG